MLGGNRYEEERAQGVMVEQRAQFSVYSLASEYTLSFVGYVALRVKLQIWVRF